MSDNKRIKKRRKKRSGYGVYILLAVVIAAIALVCFIFSGNYSTGLNQNMVAVEMNYEPASKASFHTIDNKIFYCTKDGMQLIDGKGSKLWTDTFTMQQPVMDNSGEMVAVAEKGGKVIKVYNTDGFMYEISAECPVTAFDVNKNGYAAVVMSAENEYITNIYNSLGEIVSVSKCPAQESMPVAVALSQDNRIFATSSIDTDAVSVKSDVVLRYINKEEAKTVETSDGMFAAFSAEDSVIGIIDFCEDNTMTALSDKEIINVSCGNRGESYAENWRIPVTGTMTAVDFSDNGDVAVAFRPIDDETPASVLCYSKNGKQTGKIDVSDEVQYINATAEMIITIENNVVSAYNYKGSSVWSFTASQDVKQAMLYDTTEDVLIAGTNKMRVINAKKGVNIDENYQADVEDEIVEIVTEIGTQEGTTAVVTDETTTQFETTTQEEENSDE